jgi:hypothetical protein
MFNALEMSLQETPHSQLPRLADVDELTIPLDEQVEAIGCKFLIR